MTLTLHIGFDAVSGRIVASILTDRDVDDASQVEPLLDQIAEPVEVFLGDGQRVARRRKRHRSPIPRC